MSRGRTACGRDCRSRRPAPRRGLCPTPPPSVQGEPLATAASSRTRRCSQASRKSRSMAKFSSPARPAHRSASAMGAADVERPADRRRSATSALMERRRRRRRRARCVRRTLPSAMRGGVRRARPASRSGLAMPAARDSLLGRQAAPASACGSASGSSAAAGPGMCETIRNSVRAGGSSRTFSKALARVGVHVVGGIDDGDALAAVMPGRRAEERDDPADIVDADVAEASCVLLVPGPPQHREVDMRCDARPGVPRHARIDGQDRRGCRARPDRGWRETNCARR